MAIRLNKVVRELNIGLQTAVEFLMKKSDLGEVEENPNFKLNDEQYAALVEEFKNDKEVRNQAAKIFPKKPKEKKKEPESHRAETLLETGRQQVKPLGKIDLANVGRPAKPEPQRTEPVAEKETDAAVAKVETKPAEKAEQPAPTETPVAETVVAPKEQEKPEPAAPQAAPVVEEKAPAAPVETEPQQPEAKPEVQEQPTVEKPQQEQPATPQEPAKAETPAPAKEEAEETKNTSMLWLNIRKRQKRARNPRPTSLKSSHWLASAPSVPK